MTDEPTLLSKTIDDVLIVTINRGGRAQRGRWADGTIAVRPVHRIRS